MEAVQKFVAPLIENVERVIVGKRSAIEFIMVALLCEGHVLLEDVPGSGKTMLARSVATSLGISFKRIQCTPDLMPNDVTGVSIFNQKNSEFEFRAGPIFVNILLADEINRATPRTQSALLEAMQEQQVTVDGTTRELPRPFLVLATQNPIEYEGTFPLPEAQLDRFAIKLPLGYPSEKEEREILSRRQQRKQEDAVLSQVTNAQELIQVRELVENTHLHPDLETYIVRLVQRTRQDSRVAVGASPRGSLTFLNLARAKALFQGREYVIPDDIKWFATPVLRHRIILQPAHWMAPKVADDVIADVLSKVAVPVLE